MPRNTLIPKSFLSQGDCLVCGGYTTMDGICPRCRARAMRLSPCPFCGGEAGMQPWHGGSPTKVLITCETEECSVSPQVSGETPEEAKIAWERRETEKQKWLSGVMYALAEIATSTNDDVTPLEVARASGTWDEFKAAACNYDLKRFAKVVGKRGVNDLKGNR